MSAETEESVSLVDGERATSCSPTTSAESLPCTSSCVVCRERADVLVSKEDPLRAWRVCSCEQRYVHADCAASDKDWAVRRCLDCAQRYCMPAKVTHPLPLPPLPLSPNGLKCCLCQNNRKGLHGDSPKNDLRWIRPCFCEYDVHHICIAEHYRKNKLCNACGVKYEVVKYGSVCDFFLYYLFEYTLSLLIFLGGLTLAVVCIRRIAWKFQTVGVVVLLSVLSLSIPSLLYYWLMSWSLTKRYPRFKRRFGQISVLNYSPSTHSGVDEKGKKQRRRKSRTIEEHSTYLRNWTLNTVFRTGGQPVNTSTPKDSILPNPRFSFASPAAVLSIPEKPIFVESGDSKGVARDPVAMV